MTSRSPRALLAVASIAVALAAADTYVVVLALTDMMAGVGVGIEQLQRATPIISGFLLGYVAVLPLIGRLADLVSRQRILLACMVVFTVGSVVTAMASDLDILVAGRVVQGVGGGGLVPATLALVADLWPAGQRGMPLGVVGAVQELGAVLGPVLGALILSIGTWRDIFWLNAIAGVLLTTALVALGGRGRTESQAYGIPMLSFVVGLGALILALAAPSALVDSVRLGVPFVPFGSATSRMATPIGVTALGILLAAGVAGARTWQPVLRRADLPGALLLGTALGCVILTFAASDPETEVVGPLGLALLPVAAVALGAYLWRHRVAAEPLIPRGTVIGRTRVALVVSLLVGVALVSVIVDVPLLARVTGMGDQTAAALVLVRFLVAVPLGAVCGGWALRRFGDGVVAGFGLAVATGALSVMSQWGRGSLEAWTSTVVLAAAGLGMGLALAPVNNAALADSPRDAHGTASALVVVARTVGMVVGLALLTAIGLHRYYGAVQQIPDTTDTAALVDAAILQVHTVFGGAALAAGLGVVCSVAGLGLRHHASTRRTGPADAGG